MATSKQPSDALKDLRMVVGCVSNKPQPEVKTSGVKTRGTGAATKGTKARGPMA